MIWRSTIPTRASRRSTVFPRRRRRVQRTHRSPRRGHQTRIMRPVYRRSLSPSLAQSSYSGAYPSHASPSSAKWYRRDGSISPNDPSLRTVRQGNTVRVYNSNGQLGVTVIKQGNTARAYDARGRSPVQMGRPSTARGGASSRRHPTCDFDKEECAPGGPPCEIGKN